MIRLGSDEDLDNHIVRGLRHRLADIDLVRVQDVGLSGAPDPEVLAWAAQAGRVLVSHDSSSMTAAAYARIERGAEMPGLIIVPQWVPVGSAIEDLLMVAECSVSYVLVPEIETPLFREIAPTLGSNQAHRLSILDGSCRPSTTLATIPPEPLRKARPDWFRPVPSCTAERRRVMAT